MPEEKFDTNLLRMIAAELHLLSGLHVARDLFGKSYFALGTGEKIAVDQAVVGMLGANYQWITADMLKAPTPKLADLPVPPKPQ